MVMPVSRQSQVYLKKEAVYGVSEVLASANAIRHLEAGLVHDPFNRITSPEKKQSPGPQTRFDRKKSAELGSLGVLLRPGGALNTLPESDPLLEAAFGLRTNVTLSTTADSGLAVTGAVVASAGALAKGDAVLLKVTGETASPFVRILTSVTGNTLVWAPALPAAQTAADFVKGGITYKLGTDLAISLTIAHYLDKGRDRELLGVAIDQLTLAFDPNEEPRLTASGPAKDMKSKAAVQAQPAAFTTVGAAAPPSGILGQAQIDAVVYKFITAEVAISNGMVLRNTEYGANDATEVYRKGRREVTISMESFLGDEALYDLAEAGTETEFLLQTGRTEGNIVAVMCRNVDW